MFLFQIGSIKSAEKIFQKWLKAKFLFQIGSIKSRRDTEHACPYW